MAEEQDSTQQKLKETNSFLSLVLDGIGEGLVVIDRDFRVLSANKKYCEQVKMSCESIIGKHCYEISHHIDVPCHQHAGGCECTVEKCFETGEHYQALHTHYDSKGGPVYIETKAYPMKDETGYIFSAIEVLSDVTDKVILEKRLEDVKEQYRKLYDDAPDMMHSVDGNGNIIICNKTESETLGYNFDEIMGHPFSSIIAPEERHSCMQKLKTVKQQGFFEGELKLMTKDGRRIPVFVKSRAIYDENGNFLMTDAVLRDTGVS